MEYQGWKYNYKNNKFDLTCPFVIERPKSFYKYYALTPNSVQALTEMYLYATHPNQFSDLYDCNTYLLDFSKADENILRTLYAPLYNQFISLHGSLEELRKYTPEIYKTLLYRHLGIVSLTVNRDDYTLWNYYAHNSGFCIEFDTRHFTFLHHGPFPVQYVDELTPVKVTGNLQEATFIQTNVKLKAFEAEHEWRLLVSNPEGSDFMEFDKFGEKK